MDDNAIFEMDGVMMMERGWKGKKLWNGVMDLEFVD